MSENRIPIQAEKLMQYYAEAEIKVRLLSETVQQQQTIIKNLEKELNELKGRIEGLEK